jgi:hypothetical protein
MARGQQRQAWSLLSHVIASVHNSQQTKKSGLKEAGAFNPFTPIKIAPLTILRDVFVGDKKGQKK